MGKEPQANKDIEIARQVIETEADALKALGNALNESMADAISILVEAQGFVIVAGVGKSGHIGRKIAATLASTGTPSFFVHPTEASHGDLGMIDGSAAVLAISNSGETRELRDLLIYCERQKVPVIAITAKKESFLASKATVTLLLPKTGEACPNQLAPTSSTTMTLAMGDALAIAAMERRGFTREDFGARHPGGALGMQLQRVSEYLSLYRDQPNPTLGADSDFPAVLAAISEGRCGAVSIINHEGELSGIVTDGDIRRAVMKFPDLQKVTAKDIMGTSPVTIGLHDRVSVAIEIFQTRQISQVIITEKNQPVGIIHVNDLMKEGYL